MLGRLYKKTKCKIKTVLLFFSQNINVCKKLIKGKPMDLLNKIGYKELIRKFILENTEEKGLHYLLRQISKSELLFSIKNLSKEELDLV